MYLRQIPDSRTLLSPYLMGSTTILYWLIGPIVTLQPQEPHTAP